MTYPRRSSLEYARDILACCQRIDDYVRECDLDAFLANTMIQDAVTRNIEIIGEAARQWLEVEPAAESRFSAIPFRDLYGMRNRLIHGYASMRLNTVYQVAKQDVPVLMAALHAAVLELSR